MIKGDAMKTSDDIEGKAFFLKMVGDYYRYMAESAQETVLEKARQGALQSYKEAEVAGRELPACNPIKLGLALNFSVFYYEVLNDPAKACNLAKQAFDDAIADIEHIDEDQYKDATTIMQLIRDNLTLWTSELNDEGDADNN